MTIVLAGILKKVLGSSKEYRCPYRCAPIKCKGRLNELLDEDGRHRQHHGGYMPDMRNYQRPGSVRPDTDRDEVPKIEALCHYCLASFWGKSLKTISEMKLLSQDIDTWKNTREIKIMK